MELYDAIKNRRSRRKYLPDPIPDEDIEKLILSATAAPSGCNSQCWRFIAVKSPEKIEALSQAVEAGARKFYGRTNDEQFLSNRIRHMTFFKKAPLVILVFMTEMPYHDNRVTEYYASLGYDKNEMLRRLGNPDILSIGAAVENLLLTAEEMGLGACWMNDPIIAGDEVEKLFNAPKGHRLMSVIPVGKPAYSPREKAMKELSEVFEII